MRLLPLIRMTRAYSLPYVALVGVLAPTQTRAEEGWLMLSFGPCLWILGAALNDKQHRAADAVARPERAALGKWLTPVIVATAVLSLLALGQRGTLALLAGGASVAAAALYGFTKSLPFVSMLARGLASSSLAMAGAAGMGAPPNWYFVAAVGLMDAAGNGLGDVRDVERDRSSGTRTLATLHPSLAIAACQLLHLSALRLFALGQGQDSTSWFALGLVGLIPMLIFDDESKHAGYLLFKYFVLVLQFGVAGRLTLALVALAAVPLAARLYTLSHGTHWTLAFRPRERVPIPAHAVSIRPVPRGRGRQL